MVVIMNYGCYYCNYTQLSLPGMTIRPSPKQGERNREITTTKIDNLKNFISLFYILYIIITVIIVIIVTQFNHFIPNN